MKCQIHKGETPAALGYCHINHGWWLLLLSPFPPHLSPPHTVGSGRIFHLHLTICQKEGDTRCEKLVILLGSFPFKNPFLGQVWFLGFFFSQGNWGKHFYVVLWSLLCAPRIIYTRIIRVVFRPLRYNNRQQGQKAGRYHKFKLTGTHKNYVPAWGTCAGQGLTTGKSLTGSSVGEGGRTYKFSQPCRALSLRVPCLNQHSACCLKDVLLGEQSKTRRVTSHKNACSSVFFWWCWSLPMLRSTLATIEICFQLGRCSFWLKNHFHTRALGERWNMPFI